MDRRVSNGWAVVDMLVSSLSVWGCLHFSPSSLHADLPLILFAGLVWLVVGFSAAAGNRPLRIVHEINSGVFAILLFFGLCFAFPWSSTGRSLIIASGLAAGVANVAVHLLRDLAIRATRHRDPFRLLLVGDAGTLPALADLAHSHLDMECRVVGSMGPTTEESPAVPYLGGVEALPEILRTAVIDGVVWGLPLGTPEGDFCLACCRAEGKQVWLPLERNVRPHVWHMAVNNDPEFPMLRMKYAPELSWGKRLLDVFGAGFGLVLLSPFLLIIALLIKLSSPGPVLFNQNRVGLNGRLFRFYKFRTMVPDAEAQKQRFQHLNEMDGPAFKIRNDPRVTPIGRILRKTSLDEVPQLINVLRGEMSLVGPRPLLPNDMTDAPHDHRRRMSVKPGLTCTWQVGGRNNVPFAEWMKMDLEYVDNWSFWLDIKLLVLTIPAVLSRRGAS